MKQKFLCSLTLALATAVSASFGAQSDVQTYTINIRPGFNLIANQLDNGDNGLDTILPNPPENTRIYKYIGNRFQIFTFSEDNPGWSPAAGSLAPGEGAYLYSPVGFALTFNGQPHVPILPITVSSNCNLYSRQTNGIGTYENVVGLAPMPGTRVYRLTGSGVAAYRFDPDDLVWSPSAPTAEVGESFWICPGGGLPPGIDAPPVITERPQSLTVTQGQSATFNVTAVGTPPLTYRWRHNDQPIWWSSNDVFVLPSAQLSDAGSYDVVVSNSFGSVTSAVATLTVQSPVPACCDPALNLLDNGSFEQPSIGNNSGTYLNTVPGWTALPSGAQIEFWSATAGGSPAFGNILPTAGNQHLEISANVDVETVSQVINNFNPGCPMTLCFDYTGRPGGFDNRFTMQVTDANGTLVGQGFNPPAYTSGGWQHFSTTFTPSTPPLTISFSGIPSDGQTGGAHIDNVCLMQTGQPPTITCPSDITLNIPGSSVVVNYPAPVVTGGALAGCMPPSGSTFFPGTTTVTCTATNACGSNTCAFNVIVRQVICPATGPNLVVNGSFQAPVVGSPFIWTPAVPGWTTTDPQGDFELWGPGAGIPSPSGDQHLEINAHAGDTIVSQTIGNIDTNCPATLCFYYTGRYSDPLNNRFDITILGSGLQTETLTPLSYSGGGWQLYSKTFTPVSSTLIIQFRGWPADGNEAGAHIDDVTLVDAQRPTITCPSDITLNIPGSSVVVNYPAPVITGGALAGCMPPSGSTFFPGTTTVICTATNACGSNTCAFNVIVRQVTCPATGPNLIVNGSFQAPVVGSPFIWTPAVPGWTTTDPQGDFELWGPGAGIPSPSGDQHLEINAHAGDTIVSQTIGNIDTNCPATLCFYYTGRYSDPLNNRFDITILGSGLQAETLSPLSYSGGGWQLYSKTFTPVSSTLTIQFRGWPADGNEAGAHIDDVTLVDAQRPTITCPSDITLNIPGSSVVVNYPAPVVTGGALAGCMPPSGSTFFPGTTTVICTATNACGSNTCAFNVIVRQVTCPATGPNLIVNGSFQAPVVGSPFIWTPAVPGWTTTDPQGDFELWGPGAGIPSPSGDQHLEINAHAGDTIVSQTIGNIDTNCPATLCFYYTGRYSDPLNNRFDITILGSGLQAETLSPLSYSGGGWQLYSKTFTPVSSTLTIQFRGWPADGNEAGAHIDDVTLVDAQRPTITCPSDITLNIPGTSVVVNYPTPVVTGGALAGCTPASGSTFFPGTTTVICTATNACGSNTCAFNVIVRQVTCPATGPNLIVNGSFQAPVVGSPFIWTPAVPGWTTTDPQGDFELWGPGASIPSPSGDQHLEINAHAGDTIVSQTIGNIDTNCPATLCFYYTGRYSDPLNNRFDITILGSGLQAETLTPLSYSGGGWQLYSKTFTPVSSTLTIQFRGWPADGNEAGAHIDNVTLAQDCGAHDADGDGIPDDWELAHGLDPHNASDALGDSDGDGMTNLQEFVAGTDPRNAASTWRTELLTTPGGELSLRFKVIPERIYEVQGTPSLGQAWQTMTNFSVQAAGTNEVKMPAGSTRGYFWRALVRPMK